MGRPDRSIAIISASVLAIILVAVVVVVASGSDEPTRFEPGTPQHALQRYLDAIHDGDEETALALLSENARDQIKDAQGQPWKWCADQQSRRVTVKEVDVRRERATITLTIHSVSGSGLDLDRYSYDTTVRLVEEDGWKVDDAWFCV